MSEQPGQTAGTPEEGLDTRTQLRAYALSFPGAYEEFPWGEVVVKVHKKVFVFLGASTEHDSGFSFSVKLPTTGADVLSLPFAAPTGYGLGKSGWVTFRFLPGELPPIDLLRGWIEESYRVIAPKRLLAQLGSTARSGSVTEESHLPSDDTA